MIRIISPTIKKAPAGRCIYCGATEGLSDEHILSFGLAGDSLILPSASCSGCQQATSKVETICLRHMWWPFRTQAGVPSRTAAPENFSLKRMRVNEYDAERDEIVDYTQLSMEDVPVEQYPIFYQTFEFPEPGVTAGRLASRDLSYSMWCKLEEQNFRARFWRSGRISDFARQTGGLLSTACQNGPCVCRCRIRRYFFDPVPYQLHQRCAVGSATMDWLPGSSCGQLCAPRYQCPASFDR